MRYHFYTADVFTSEPFSGNQLAVFPDPRGLDGQVMQRIAREINFSETVFVLPPENPRHTQHLRIFTPGAEVPFAGHPTVGTAYVLAATGAIPLQGETTHIVFEEGVGAVPVTIQAQAGKPTFTWLSAAKLPEFGPPPPPIEDLAAMLFLDASDLLRGDYSPQAVSCGLPFLFIPLQNRDALRRSHLDMGLWAKLLSSYWTQMVFVFTFDSGEADVSLRARMYAPGVGVSEDPATGAAATALAGYLGVRDETRDGMLKWVVRQGVEMGRRSTLYVEADKSGGEIRAIRVGGASVLMSEGWMDIP
jgi:trans-2,3-dihydro-3-hydroxyanthranilate isomerase